VNAHVMHRVESIRFNMTSTAQGGGPS